MFDTLLIITLFLLALLLVCLLTLRLSINIKHLCHSFDSLLILTDILEIPTPPFILTTPFIKFNKDLQLPSPPPHPFILTPPFIKHLRLCLSGRFLVLSGLELQ